MNLLKWVWHITIVDWCVCMILLLLEDTNSHESKHNPNWIFVNQFRVLYFNIFNSNLVWWWTTSRGVNTTKNHEAWRNTEHHHQTNPSLQIPHCSHRHHIIAFHTWTTTDLFPVPLLVLLVTHSKMHQSVPSTKDSDHRCCDHRGAKGRLKDRLWVYTKRKARIK